VTLKILIHAPTADALLRARRNLRNFLAEAPDGAVEIVANGEAVRIAVTEPDPDTDHLLILCENSLRTAKLNAPAAISTTAAAIVHIARRQSDGWAYFRA
jgi:NitT/TauT family transport system ATP-binding protein